MARRRYISTDISTDARINQLPEFGQLLYTWMIPHAGDDGGITADPLELKMLVVPGLARRKPTDVAAAVAVMLEVGLLCQGPDHRLYFPSDSFYKYQTYVTAERRRTPQNAAPTDLGASAADQRKTPQIATSASVPVSGSLKASFDPPLSPPAGGARVRGSRKRNLRNGNEPEPGSVKARVIGHFDALARGSGP